MATINQFSLLDSNLFYGVRASGLTDRGLYLGHEPDTGFGIGDIYCVLADACFYALEVFRPPTGLSAFSTSAQTVTLPPSAVPAIVNGQVCSLQVTSGSWLWAGDIIEHGGAHHGLDNPNEADARYIGKWPGRTEVANDVCRKGSSVGVTPPLDDAISNLLPIVRKGTPFLTVPDVDDEPIPHYDVEYYSPTWFDRQQTSGTVLFGIHRTTQLIFFFVQEDGATGYSVQWLIKYLTKMGVEDAVVGDGSDSTCRVVDGQILAQPGHIKDRTLPVGLRFRRDMLTVGSGSTTFDQCDDFALWLKLGMLPSIQTGAVAILSWGPGGLELSVTSFGGGLSATDLGLDALPLTLTQTTPDNNLVGGVHFGSGDGHVTLDCQIVVSGPTDLGRLTGTLTVKQPVSTAVMASGTIDWPLA